MTSPHSHVGVVCSGHSVIRTRRTCGLHRLRTYLQSPRNQYAGVTAETRGPTDGTSITTAIRSNRRSISGRTAVRHDNENERSRKILVVSALHALCNPSKTSAEHRTQLDLRYILDGRRTAFYGGLECVSCWADKEVKCSQIITAAKLNWMPYRTPPTPPPRMHASDGDYDNEGGTAMTKPKPADSL